MKLLSRENLMVFKTKLCWDIYYFQYRDIDYLGHWRPEKVIEFIRIWKCEPYPLLKPLLIINPPRISWIYDKRILWNYINSEIEKKQGYLERIGNILSKQLELLILNKEIFYITSEAISKDDKLVWVRVPKRIKFLIDFLYWDSPDDKGSD